MSTGLICLLIYLKIILDSQKKKKEKKIIL